MKVIPDNHDVRLKYYELIMERSAEDNIPDYVLPDGYRFVYYQPGDIKDWIAIETSAREFVLEEEGEDAWNRYYRGKEKELENRMLFIENPLGEKVATATAFYESSDISHAGWLHWVAIKRTEQRKGLARPLIAKTLSRLEELGYHSYKVPTQTTTWVAARLYMDFGFKPVPMNAFRNKDGYRIMKTLTDHPSLCEFESIPYEEIWDRDMVCLEEKLRREVPDLLYFTVRDWEGSRKILYRTKTGTGTKELYTD